MARQSLGEPWSESIRGELSTLVQTRRRYSELAKQCMENIAERINSPSGSTSLQFNHKQREYLVNKLKIAIKTSETFALSHPAEFNSEYFEIMKLLWRSAKEVESFIQGCHKDNWIRAALFMANMTEHVVVLGSKLDLCTLLLRNDNIRLMGAGPNWEEQLDAFDPCKLVKDSVSEDQSALILWLRDQVYQSSNSSDQERELAQNCLQGRLVQHFLGLVRLTSAWEIDFSNLKQVQRLGSGSVGVVRKSMWLAGQTEIEVAEKMFYGSDHPSFKNEVEVLVGLAHPNIVPLLGYAMDESRCSIVMELMDGDLSFLMEERMREKHTCKSPFTLFEAVDLMLQTAEGMLYLHQRKVVHRDLKSQNILVKHRKNIDAEYVYVKVADFGLAKTKEKSSTYSNQTSNTGTTRWMAPELMTFGPNDLRARTSECDPELRHPFKVDVYSFGMVCYEILTGRVPFWTISSLREVKMMVLDGVRPKLPEQCTHELQTLISSCWESEASLRPSFVDICRRLRFLKVSLMIGPSFQGIPSGPLPPQT